MENWISDSLWDIFSLLSLCVKLNMCSCCYCLLLHTVRNLHFLSKNSTLISRENCRFFFGWKTRENVVVLGFLAVDNFDVTRKIVKKNDWVKNSWKCWGFVKIEFLDKNLTFRIVCSETDGFRAAEKILMWVLSCIFLPFDRRYNVECVRNRLFS